ncbi:hypothetical protein FRB96_009613 [Tulasnella sp. 330]|nr:hypothetical protein FRB96_009613 [Tulasnella sp. 330]KAG8873750.1 hypothetical protein FRB97_006454 [Tulasnella sp. 331]
MRFAATFSLIAAFSVIALPIQHQQLLGSGSILSKSIGDRVEKEEAKLKKRGAQDAVKLGGFKVGPLIFGSITGTVGVIGTKKIYEWLMVHRYFNELKQKQAHNITTPDPRGPSFDATGRNLTAEIALNDYAIWHNVNQVPTSPQSLTAKYRTIYPGFVDPSKLSGKAIIIDEKEAVTVTVTVTAGAAGSTGVAASSSISNSTGTIPALLGPQPVTGEGTKEEPVVSIATILPAPSQPSYLPVDVPNTASIVQVNAVHLPNVHGKREA